MKATEAQALIEVINRLSEPGQVTPSKPGKKPEVLLSERSDDGAAGRFITSEQAERLYLQFKERMIDDLRTDPILLQLIALRPEIVVEFEPTVITIDGSSARGRVARLIANGFLDQPKRQGAVRSELARTGSDVNSGNLSVLFSEFVRQGFLTREGESYVKAPGIKVTEKRLESK